MGRGLRRAEPCRTFGVPAGAVQVDRSDASALPTCVIVHGVPARRKCGCDRGYHQTRPSEMARSTSMRSIVAGSTEGP